MASEAINAQACLWVPEPCLAQSSVRLQAAEKARPLALSPARVPEPVRRSSREAKKCTFLQKQCFVSGWTVRLGCVSGRNGCLTRFCSCRGRNSGKTDRRKHARWVHHGTLYQIAQVRAKDERVRPQKRRLDSRVCRSGYEFSRRSEFPAIHPGLPRPNAADHRRRSLSSRPPSPFRKGSAAGRLRSNGITGMYGPLSAVNDASGECPLGGQLTMNARTVE